MLELNIEKTHTQKHCYKYCFFFFLFTAVTLDQKKKKFYIAGVDISFVKGDDVNACAALVVLNFPKLQV